MQRIFEGRFYIRNAGGAMINFGKDFDVPFEHTEELVAKWDSDAKRLIIARKKDIMSFDK